MPEGPEARCFADQLRERHSGKVIVELARSTKSAKHNAIANFNRLCRKLPLTVVTVYAVGKKVIWKLTDRKERQYYIVISLGISGKFVPKWQKGCDFAWHFGEFFPGEKHSCYIVTEKQYYLDSRHHGQIYFLMSDDELTEFLRKKVGLDLLDFAIREKEGNLKKNEKKKLYEQWFAKASSKRRTHWQVVQFMMKQEEFCGIGNYVKAEALGRTGLSPKVTLAELVDERPDQFKLLLDNVLDVLYESYRSCGATLRDFVDLNGKKGKFKCRFYGKREVKAGQKVYEIIREDTADKRTTHWAPKYQK